MIHYIPKVESFQVALEAAVTAGNCAVAVVDGSGHFRDDVLQLRTEAFIVEPARQDMGNLMIDLRQAVTLECQVRAQELARSRPLFVAFPQVVSHAQAQLAGELGVRGVDVLVGAERAAVLQLLTDPTLLDKVGTVNHCLIGASMEL